jgi:uncharacterized protein
MTTDIYTAFILFLLVAMLYSSVGHAGASGYLAIMALLSFSPDVIKPTSLILNVVVASIASFKFIKGGFFDRKIFVSFIITSVPMSFVGGYLSISPQYFKLFAGIFLVVSAILLLARALIKNADTPYKSMPPYLGLILGGIIGLISGLIGVGGGIFLSPIIIMANWTSVKNASGIAALFILFNSLSGLAGHLSAFSLISTHIGYWMVAVIIGGSVGSYLGTSKLSNKIIITCLFFVLLTAGLKFILIDFAK